MNFYMREWLFMLSFIILAFAYFMAYQKSKLLQLKMALVLVVAVVLLGAIDVARTSLSSSFQQTSPFPQPSTMMQMQSQ